MHLFFVDENNGWATLYNSGNILHTIDGGDTWEIQEFYHFLSSNIRTVYFTDNNIGWGGGAMMMVIYTMK